MNALPSQNSAVTQWLKENTAPNAHGDYKRGTEVYAGLIDLAQRGLSREEIYKLSSLLQHNPKWGEHAAPIAQFMHKLTQDTRAAKPVGSVALADLEWKAHFASFGKSAEEKAKETPPKKADSKPKEIVPPAKDPEKRVLVPFADQGFFHNPFEDACTNLLRLCKSIQNKTSFIKLYGKDEEGDVSFNGYYIKNVRQACMNDVGNFDPAKITVVGAKAVHEAVLISTGPYVKPLLDLMGDLAKHASGKNAEAIQGFYRNAMKSAPARSLVSKLLP